MHAQLAPDERCASHNHLVTRAVNKQIHAHSNLSAAKGLIVSMLFVVPVVPQMVDRFAHRILARDTVWYVHASRPHWAQNATARHSLQLTQIVAHTSTSDTASETTHTNRNLSGAAPAPPLLNGLTESVLSVGPVVPVPLTVFVGPMMTPAQKVDRF